jgi:hypothetical protein
MSMNDEIDAKVENFAPDSDCLAIHIADWKIIVERDDNGSVHVILHDTMEGSRTFYTLGQTDETQLV